MRTILWFIYFWWYLIRVNPLMKKVCAMEKEGRGQECDVIVGQEAQKWASSLLKKAGVTVTVEGLENLPQEGAMVLAPNHQGYFDIPLMLTMVPRTLGFFSKIEVKKIPFIRDWMEKLHCVFVDRGDKRSAMKSVHDAVATLKAGHSLVIFPEGTRSKGGPVKEFKQGAFKIAHKAKVPVVPVCIDGSHKVMESNHYFIRPAHVRVRVLPAIDVASMERDAMEEVSKQVRQHIVEALEQRETNP